MPAAAQAGASGEYSRAGRLYLRHRSDRSSFRRCDWPNTRCTTCESWKSRAPQEEPTSLRSRGGIREEATIILLERLTTTRYCRIRVSERCRSASWSGMLHSSKSTYVGPIGTNLDRCLPHLSPIPGRIRHRFGPNRPKLGPNRPKLGRYRCWPTCGRVRA